MMKNIKFVTLVALASVICTGLTFFAMAQQNPLKKETMFTLRVARPTDNLPEVLKFYRDALGLEVLSSFDDKGFEGVILGFAHKGSPYHLEFTHQPDHKVGKAPTQDSLLVFLYTGRSSVEECRRADAEAWLQACQILQPVLGRRWQDL